MVDISGLERNIYIRTCNEGNILGINYVDSVEEEYVFGFIRKIIIKGENVQNKIIKQGKRCSYCTGSMRTTGYSVFVESVVAVIH